MRRVARYELCDSCRKIITPAGFTLGEFLDSKGYSGPDPRGYLYGNQVILQFLQQIGGGCSKCINLFM